MAKSSALRLLNPIKGMLVVGLIAAVFGAGYAVRGWLASPATSPETERHADATQEAAQQWMCAMHPQIRQPKPGKCPICAMDLVPLVQPTGGLRQLTVTPESKKLMAIETTPVVRRYATATIRMVGKVTYDETRLAYISAWVGGRLDRMFVNYTGVQVEKGHHMVSIYSPDLYSAQNDLIQALRFAEMRKSTPGEINFVESAKEKLRLLGLKDEQIAVITKDSKPSDHITIYSPAAGTVIHKNRQEGDYVRVGERIYTISDLTQVWVMLDAYESDLIWIRYGQDVTFTSEAYPGEEFVGRIAFIDRVLNDRTRTVKVRVNVANPAGKLKPEMFIRGVVHSRVAAGGRVMDPGLAGKWISPMHPEIVKDQPGKCDICGMPLVRAEELGYASLNEPASEPLVIPVSAALVTGTRAIVYVELPGQPQPTYEGREIVLGPRAGDYYLVRHGIKEGEMVVTRGNFKIDSALQIQAKPSMMTPEGGGGVGHHHGGSPAKGADAGTSPPLEIPVAFRDQLRAVDAAFATVGEAVATGDVGRIRTAFELFAAALKGVDAGLLTGHARMMWDELSMLLGNDAAEGQAVKELAEAQRVAALLTDHIRRVHDQFASPHAEHGSSRPPVPLAFQKQIGGLWSSYQDVQQGLASDDPKRARDSATRLQTLLAKLIPGELPAPLLAVWQKEKPQLELVVKSFLAAKDLEGLREHFAPLTGSIAAVVTAFGTGESGAVYRLRCSMAFDGRGGTWLQKDIKPLNPYFGSEMLRCADSTEKLMLPEPASMPKKDNHDHE